MKNDEIDVSASITVLVTSGVISFPTGRDTRTPIASNGDGLAAVYFGGVGLVETEMGFPEPCSPAGSRTCISGTINSFHRTYEPSPWAL